MKLHFLKKKNSFYQLPLLPEIKRLGHGQKNGSNFSKNQLNSNDFQFQSPIKKLYFLINRLLLLAALISRIKRLSFGLENESKFSKNQLNTNNFPFQGHLMNWHFLIHWLLLLVAISAQILKVWFWAKKLIEKSRKVIL